MGPKGSKKSKAEPKIDENETLLKWLTSRKKRQEEILERKKQQQKKEKQKEKLKDKDKDKDQSKEKSKEKTKQGEKAKRTKKIKKHQMKGKFDHSKHEKIKIKSKTKQSDRPKQAESKQHKMQKKDKDSSPQPAPQIITVDRAKEQNEEVLMEVEHLDEQGNDPIIKEIKRGRGRKKKNKPIHIQKCPKKDDKKQLNLEDLYPHLFTNQQVSSAQYIFNKYNPTELDKYRKGHQEVMQVEPQIEMCYNYAAEQKHKPGRQPSEPLPDGRRYQVPIKVCTCCNFFGKRHLCPHNLCSKPCPIQHRKTKIRDRYFERYKHRPKVGEDDDDDDLEQ